LFAFNGKKNKEKSQENNLENYIHTEYQKMGPVKLVNFKREKIKPSIILWVTRDLFFVPGWGALFKKSYTTDTTPAILILIVLVSWPKYNIFKQIPYEHLICWNKINESFPWNIIILSGENYSIFCKL
jgi:hypothetical protein